MVFINMRKATLYVILLFLLFPIVSKSQSFYALRRNRDLIFNGGTGASQYFGELANPKQLNRSRMNLSAGLEYFVSNRISLRGDLTWFQLSGSDEFANSDRKERNLSFFSNNLELDALGSIQLFPNESKFYKRHGFNIYGFAGVGLLYFNPKTRYEGEVYALQPLQTEGVKYSRFQFVIPFGLGVKLKINPLLDLSVDGSFRETFTDYLDDISKRRYVDRSTLPGGVNGISAKLSDRRNEIGTEPPNPTEQGVRGNPQKEDAYFLFSARISYYLPLQLNGSNLLYRQKRKVNKNAGGMYKVRRKYNKRR